MFLGLCFYEYVTLSPRKGINRQSETCRMRTRKPTGAVIPDLRPRRSFHGVYGAVKSRAWSEKFRKSLCAVSSFLSGRNARKWRRLPPPSLFPPESDLQETQNCYKVAKASRARRVLFKSQRRAVDTFAFREARSLATSPRFSLQTQLN